jgi:hypothetical protein
MVRPIWATSRVWVSAGAWMVGGVGHEDLGLVFEASKRAGVEDAVPVALELRPQHVGSLRFVAAPPFVRGRRPRGQTTCLGGFLCGSSNELELVPAGLVRHRSSNSSNAPTRRSDPVATTGSGHRARPAAGFSENRASGHAARSPSAAIARGSSIEQMTTSPTTGAAPLPWPPPACPEGTRRAGRGETATSPARPPTRWRLGVVGAVQHHLPTTDHVAAQPTRPGGRGHPARDVVGLGPADPAVFRRSLGERQGQVEIVDLVGPIQGKCQLRRSSVQPGGGQGIAVPAKLDELRSPPGARRRQRAPQRRIEGGTEDGGLGGGQGGALVRGDGFAGRTQPLPVVGPDHGQSGDCGFREPRGVPPTAHPRFQNRHVHALLGELQERHRGERFEKREVRVGFRTLEMAAQCLIGDHPPVDTDAFSDRDQMR